MEGEGKSGDRQPGQSVQDKEGLEHKQEVETGKPGSFDYSNGTALQKHVEFFDRNRDGVISPLDTFRGFRDLGYNWFLSVCGMVLIHGFMSYVTLDTWVPDPFFRIYVKNIDRCKHGSDTESYDFEGNFRSENMDSLLKKLSNENVPDNRHSSLIDPSAVLTAPMSTDGSKSNIGEPATQSTSETEKASTEPAPTRTACPFGMSLKDIMRMNNFTRDVWDFPGMITSRLEWRFLWMLARDEKGVVSREKIYKNFDGSLFFEMAEKQRQKKEQLKEEQRATQEGKAKVTDEPKRSETEQKRDRGEQQALKGQTAHERTSTHGTESTGAEARSTPDTAKSIPSMSSSSSMGTGSYSSVVKGNKSMDQQPGHMESEGDDGSQHVDKAYETLQREKEREAAQEAASLESAHQRISLTAAGRRQGRQDL